MSYNCPFSCHVLSYAHLCGCGASLNEFCTGVADSLCGFRKLTWGYRDRGEWFYEENGTLKSTTHYPATRSSVVFAIISLVLVVLVGWIDYLTGSQIAFSTFYLIPICLVT